MTSTNPPDSADAAGAPDQLRLMAVHAHPDDESSKGAATMARYVDEGVRVVVVTCTGGERGSILNPALKDRKDIEENISEIRKAEMDRAREILGVEQHWLGFVDSGLPEGDPLPPLPEGCFGLTPVEVGTEALVREIRRVRPHVMTTYDPNGGYPHPDHIMCHKISVAAFEAAGDPDRFPGAGEPWQPSKLYYDVGFNRERITALDRVMTDRGLESPFAEWRKRWDERELPDDWYQVHVTTQVPCGDWFERRDAALIAHATQVDPEGMWFKIPLELQREVWPTEDYELARSFVDTEQPEDDLFAGVRDRVSV